MIVSGQLELGTYELKQGMLTLDSKRSIDAGLIEKVIRTICAMANNGPGCVGKIILGVTDKDADAIRIRTLDNIEPKQIGRRYIVGVAREAAVLQIPLADYFTRWKEAIRKSQLSGAVGDSVLSNIDFNSYFGLGAIVITVPPQTELSYVGNEVFWRNADSTELADMKLEDVSPLLGQPETERLEYKRGLPPPALVARQLAAFANTQGGWLVVGADEGPSGVSFPGIPDDAPAAAVVAAAIRRLSPTPPAIHGRLVHNGARLYVVGVEPETALTLTESGTTYRRRGTQLTRALPTRRPRNNRRFPSRPSASCRNCFLQQLRTHPKHALHCGLAMRRSSSCSCSHSPSHVRVVRAVRHHPRMVGRCCGWSCRRSAITLSSTLSTYYSRSILPTRVRSIRTPCSRPKRFSHVVKACPRCTVPWHRSALVSW